MGEVLTTTGIIALISAAFAILLSLADKFLNNYGIVKLNINEEKDYEVEGGQSLLNTLKQEKIFLPSACGGKGTCAYCKCKVNEGGGPVLATEKPFLSAQEEKDNVRLACQVKVKNNIDIEIPEDLFNVKEIEAEVVEKIPMTDRIVKIRFKLPEGETINFKPGQFMQLQSKPYPKGEDYMAQDESWDRAYSIASSANDHGHIELLIGQVLEGRVSTYVHKILKEGDKATLVGPFGDFYYSDDDSEEIIMVAAGTGFAPIRSILYHMLDNDIKKKARFYFGARTKDDLFLLDEMKMFEEKLHDFKFMPTLSRPSEADKWTGDTGRVNNSIDKYVDENTKYSAYLCGSPVMIQGIVKSLVDKKVSEDHIFFDEF
ncbi:NADH:ubiquinone reductase (Na(+)-transporting) subunit F [Helcococcus sueciensis]|uniref:NADH:ubiquinone reductase (Na(+)-transporting) subunit F n=1 Tax=Helcococcus sueciensis TaxID=241555 RepID=UPI0004288D28|nr:2Fe-2S iron-sulfur cluster binding domain-containing protein [Helcococcus sueciensis]